MAKASRIKQATKTAPEARRPKARATNKRAAAPTKQTGPSIAGIGASAGGLEAFTQLLSALPTDTGMAFVFVQHLEPKHASVLTKLLARATEMPVQEAREGMHVKPNHVYVVPPNSDMSLSDGLLHVRGRKGTAGVHLPIDYFFTSLAEARGPRAIGVILSGTASDGTAGIKAIKDAGGMTFAQTPESAKFDGMPRNAIASGCVELVLPPDRIAKELARMVHHPFLGALQADEVPALPALKEEWIRLFRILRDATGVDFGLYKQSTIKRRLARRMAVCKANTLGAYLRILEDNRSEVNTLFEELLILVTEFFRDPEVFLALRSKILPRILAHKPAGEPIRIWVAGCSTGQEAYSIAISLLECRGDEAAGMRIQIFGSDVSETAIETARHGIYAAAHVKGVSQEQLRRYFTAVNGNFQVNKPIREMCVFAKHDLTRDPPFSKLDLISCRNVLIYMEPVLHRRILAAFHWALKPGGVLLLGGSGSLSAHTDLFSPIDRKNKFFKKSPGADVPLSMVQPAHQKAFAGKPPLKEPAPSIDLEKQADQALWERSGYAGLVVDNDLQILHVRGDTSPYVRLVPGKASLQLLHVLREEIVLAVRVAVQKARQSERPIRSEGIRFRHNGRTSEVNIEVRPLIRSGPEKSFLILFERPAMEPARAGARQAKAAKKESRGRDQEVVRLHGELAPTREYVKVIIRDQEASNEELKAANEEALSSMQELQSSNEQLETAKEELQSSNEELVTLNEQLQTRNSELAQLSNDLSNVLSGINIPVVILDSSRRIRRFTPPAEDLLGLTNADIGRPIGRLRLKVDIPHLQDLVSAAIEKGRVASQEVQSVSGNWYSLHIHPFIVGEDQISGVLISFVDVNELKQRQERETARADQSESTVRALLETAAQAILAIDKDGRIQLANATAEVMFGYPRHALLGQPVESLIPERFRSQHARDRMDWFVQPHGRPMGIGLDLAGLRKDGSEFPIEVSLSSIGTEEGTLGVAFVSDFTERKNDEQALAESRNQLASEVATLSTLREASDRLWQSHDLRAGLEEMIDAGMALLGADFGNIQLFNPDKQVLEIVAQRGFGPDFLEHFREVSAGDDSACGRSLRTKQRLIIEDVDTDAAYAPHRGAAAAAGYRAVQSRPLLGSDGSVLGVFSTHFRKPHRPTEFQLGWFDLYAHRAAQFIERMNVEEKLQKLTGALILAQEAGDREIARELHDVFSQELVGLSMEISSLRKGAETDMPGRISELSKKARGIAEALHRTSRSLHPAILEDLGLAAALRQECDSFQKNYGTATNFTERKVPAKIPPEVALCLYRVAQESLRNIQKHAPDADRVQVSLTGSAGGITLEVEDTGDGFELDAALRKGGLGLISIEERLRLVNGKLTTQSQPGKGTIVSAFVPLPGGGPVDEPGLQNTAGRRSQSGPARPAADPRRSRV
jgi:two-component system, chemotaxis family, CheB/CheR fusion protein